MNNLFEILTVCQAIFDEEWEYTGAMTIETVYAYNDQDIDEWKYLSKMNGMEAVIW